MAFNSKADLLALLSQAEYHVEENVKYATCKWFYRNKPYAYFTDIQRNHSGVMQTYAKDGGGDPGCPINNRLDGLFFSPMLDPKTKQPRKQSPFGNRRLSVPAKLMLAPPDVNMYFADFFCTHVNGQHYVVLVLTRQGSASDAFCKKHLVQLDKAMCPFLRLRGQGRQSCVEVMLSGRVMVELMWTEDMHIPSLEGQGAKFSHCSTLGRGHSTPGGLPKPPNCIVCNVCWQRPSNWQWDLIQTLTNLQEILEIYSCNWT